MLHKPIRHLLGRMLHHTMSNKRIENKNYGIQARKWMVGHKEHTA
jgi:hypothetical protein